MATDPKPVDELEQQAERQRQQLGRHVAELRHGLEQSLDLRHLAEDVIRSRPGTIYGVAALLTALTGYIFARLLKI